MARYDDLMAELIFDRTASDVENKTNKGYYNVSDYTRLCDCIKYISDELGLGLEVNYVSLGDIVYREDFQLILDNIDACRKGLGVEETTDPVPTLVSWDWERANEIEKILYDLLIYFRSRENDKLYSGMFKAGDHIKFRGENKNG